MRRGAPARRPVATSAAPGTEPSLPLAQRAWEQLLAVHKRALAALRASLERDLTLPRFELLGALSRADGQTMAALSQRLQVKPKNLSGLAERAERDGLIERRADPASRRSWTLFLTPKGQRAFRDAERRHHARLGRIFGALAPAELGALTSLLDKLRAAQREPTPPPLSSQGPAGTRAHAERSGVGKRRLARPKRSPKDPV